MRRGLENSVNIVTAHLLDGGIDADPAKSLDEFARRRWRRRSTAIAFAIIRSCSAPQPVRMIDLAAFYAAVANEGARPQPHGIDSIEQNGETIYRYPAAPLPFIGSADRTSFYQLKTILQGVVARGTARAIASLSPYVAGKTGTTEDAVDGWFVGFTNDVTVAVWVGYDNGDGKRRSLGPSETGSRVALPIFEPIIAAVWAEHVAPKAVLSGPSREAQKHLIDLPIDYLSGDRVTDGRASFVEHFRLGADGRFTETQNQLLGNQDADASGDQEPSSGFGAWGWGAHPGRGRYSDGRSYYSGQQAHAAARLAAVPAATAAAAADGAGTVHALRRSRRSAQPRPPRSGLFLGRTPELTVGYSRPAIRRVRRRNAIFEGDIRNMRYSAKERAASQILRVDHIFARHRRAR